MKYPIIFSRSHYAYRVTVVYNFEYTLLQYVYLYILPKVIGQNTIISYHLYVIFVSFMTMYAIAIIVDLKAKCSKCTLQMKKGFPYQKSKNDTC